LEFRPELWCRKTRVTGLSWHCLRDPVFSRFGTKPAHGGRTNTWRQHIPHQHSVTVKTIYGNIVHCITRLIN